MASAALSRRVRKVVAYPPLSGMSDLQRREFHEALLDADSFEGLPGMDTLEVTEPSLASESRARFRSR
jgi:hypothetical protein